MTFTSSVSGGSPPYSYQWYLDGSAVSGATSPAWTFAPTSLQPIGNYTVYMIVTDSLLYTAQSNSAIVSVAPALTVQISPLSASALVGQPITFTATVLEDIHHTATNGTETITQSQGLIQAVGRSFQRQPAYTTYALKSQIPLTTPPSLILQ